MQHSRLLRMTGSKILPSHWVNSTTGTHSAFTTRRKDVIHNYQGTRGYGVRDVNVLIIKPIADLLVDCEVFYVC